MNMSSYHTKGHIQIIFGPMFSGKTTELMRRMKRFELAAYKCVLIRYAKDNRYDSCNMSTHDRRKAVAMAATKLSDLLNTPELAEADVVGVDEGQFFPDVVAFCEQLADKGKVVIVSALDGTFQRQGFGDILNLVPLAEQVVKLTAVCMQCCGEASFTKRKGQETAVEVIGGADKYLAVCRECYHKATEVRTPFKNLENSPVKEQTPPKSRGSKRLFEGGVVDNVSSVTAMD